MSNPLWNHQQANQPSNNWLNQSSSQTPVVNEKLKTLYRMYQATTDKQGFLNKMADSNPMLGNLIKKGNTKDLFYAECQKRGVDPDAFILQFRNSIK